MTEQELTLRLKAALAAHRQDVLDGACAAQRPARAVLDRHRAVADASERLMAWWAVRAPEAVDA